MILFLDAKMEPSMSSSALEFINMEALQKKTTFATTNISTNTVVGTIVKHSVANSASFKSIWKKTASVRKAVS